MTFFPLLAVDRGISPSETGLARLPAGWLLDRTRARRPHVVGGLLAAAAGTALIPQLSRPTHLLLLGAGLGVAAAALFWPKPKR